MRAVLQRVRRAKVTMGTEVTGEIAGGWLVLLGVAPADTQKEIDWLAEKVVNLRAFDDPAGKMNLSVQDVGGAVLVVSQFTLYGDCRKGRRPNFMEAAKPDAAKELYEYFNEQARAQGVRVEEGVFRAMMQVGLVNEGPVTLLLDSRRLF